MAGRRKIPKRSQNTFVGNPQGNPMARPYPKIPPGSVCDEVATTMDLLPTFAGLSGAAVPSDRRIDGKDVVDLLLAKPGARSPHEKFFTTRSTN
jgi:arylsulfatase A-like enzyme